MKLFSKLALAAALMGGVSGMASPFPASATKASVPVMYAASVPGIPENVDWLVVNVETPGSLGVEILYNVETLPDVKALRVTGNLNSADGTTLKNLTQVEYLDLSGCSLKALPESAFQNRTTLKGIILPDDLESIGANAFQNTGLTYLTVPASVKSLGGGCFHNNKTLLEATILSAADIPESAFNSCTALEKVTITGDVVNLGAYTFYDCQKLKEVTLPSSLLTIGGSAFYNTKSLADLVLPEGLISLGYMAFYYSGIKSIVLPPYLSLYNNVFYYCRSLESVTLPSTLYAIPQETFYNCDALKEVVCPQPAPPSWYSNAFANVNLSNATLKVPEYALVNYKLDSNWMKFGKIEGTAPYSSICLNKEFSFANNRRPESGVDVRIDLGGKLSIGGNAPFNMNGLTLTYNPYSGYQNTRTSYGQIINSSPAVKASNGTLKYYMEGNRWYFISSPVDIKIRDLSISPVTDFVVREYDGAERAANGSGNSWKDLSLDATIKAGKGYIFRSIANTWITVSLGETACANLLANTDRILSPSVFEAEDAANAGWNLLANPWPSYYDLSFSDLDTPLLIWDTANGKYVAYSLLDDKVVLEPGQPFFIQHAEEGSVKLPGEGRCFTSSGIVSEEAPETRGMTQRYLFDFTIASKQGSDRARIVFNPEAEYSYEIGRDVAKFFSDQSASPFIYTLDNGGNPLAINERPAGNGEVQLILSAKVAGTYQLSASHADGTVEIRDVKTGKVTPLLHGESINVEIPGEEETCSRYVALIKESATSGVDEVKTKGILPQIIAGEGSITVSGNDGTLEIYSSDGKLMHIVEGNGTIALIPGLYIVHCGKMSVKCIVR
ncbi:MAG: leucine-rich repeat domain-containing protein [Muribaculaceae bacterium]|nr:leucine-rich repeat domain-containing protein [Muribaculaceae bacterium]